MKENRAGMKAVSNLTFDGNASQRGLEKAAKDISKAIADEGRDSKKAIVDAVKVGSERVADAVGRIKIANAEASSAPTPAADVVYEGLRDIALSAADVAEFFHSNPNEWGAVGEKMVAVNQQFGKLVESVKQYSEGREQLQRATAEVSQAAGWLGSSLPNGGGSGGGNGGNAQTIFVGNSFDALWQKYGG